MLTPKVNEMLVFEAYTLLVLSRGSGVFQVDFRNYSFSSGKAIFLSPGQYFSLLSGAFEIGLYEFSGDHVQQMQNSRYLFKHLVSLGYIDLSQPKRFHLTPLQYLQIEGKSEELLHSAIENWIKQNPFKASISEVNLLFDLKDVIDQNYYRALTIEEIAGKLSQKPYLLRRVTRERLKQTIKQLAHGKLLLEARRMVVFTDFSTKEIAYDLGFSEPNYFNRFFKRYTQKTPGEFRDSFHYQPEDRFIGQFTELLNQHFQNEHFMGFYAEKLGLSTKALSKKIKLRLGVSFHRLLSELLINEALNLLNQGVSITESAYSLGFQEANHFTTFFKNHTGQTPSNYLTHA